MWRDLLPSVPLPWKVLKKKLDAAVPRQAARRWELIGQIETQDGEIIVFDPWYYHPDYGTGDEIYQVTLQGPAGGADVFLERIEIDVDHWRNAAVKILFFDDVPETRGEKIGQVSVDSAMLDVASKSSHQERWMVGGALSQSSLYIRLMDKEKRNAEGKRAADLLAANGFQLAHKHDWLYGFTRSLSNEDIERANALLQEASIGGMVNTVVHHSLALIRTQLNQRHVAVLDADAQPYLVAFESGWGDGTYDCFELKSEDRTIGFLSQMIEPDEIA